MDKIPGTVPIFPRSGVTTFGCVTPTIKADRVDGRGRVTYLAHGKGYVMIRRPGCIPFTLPEKEWRALPLFQKSK